MIHQTEKHTIGGIKKECQESSVHHSSMHNFSQLQKEVDGEHMTLSLTSTVCQSAGQSAAGAGIHYCIVNSQNMFIKNSCVLLWLLTRLIITARVKRNKSTLHVCMFSPV